jgi:hypothetical protein
MTLYFFLSDRKSGAILRIISLKEENYMFFFLKREIFSEFPPILCSRCKSTTLFLILNRGTAILSSFNDLFHFGNKNMQDGQLIDLIYVIEQTKCTYFMKKITLFLFLSLSWSTFSQKYDARLEKNWGDTIATIFSKSHNYYNFLLFELDYPTNCEQQRISIKMSPS